MNEALNNNPKEFWKAVLGQIQLEISPMVYKTMVSRTTGVSFENDTLEVFCEDNFVKKNLETKFSSVVDNSVKNIGGKGIKIKYSVSKEKEVKENKDELGPLFSQQKTAEKLNEEKRIKSNLNPKFSFDNFILGKNNNLAYAIATAISEKPGELYNPVFIYSKVGLGKTHLIQAVGNKIIETKPGMRVVYTTGEAFTNELIETIQSGKGRGKYTANQFREKFRKADVLLIDDVQFIIGRESTQEEFFHTFNALYMSGKQILITSDRPPKDFNSLEERITSRFSSGIVADIQNPDVETRVAILRSKRDAEKENIPNEVLNFIAERVDSNIRELEGAYIQVITYAKATGDVLTVDTAARALGATVKEKVVKNVNVNEILKAVCLYYSVKIQDIKGKRRHKELVLPRQVAMYLMKEITDIPFMSIGELLGGRDHTTVMHGVNKIQEEIAETGKVTQDIVNVKQIIFND
ncbi:MAG TPA: chromosomal replication initiator protein DnaA [bacterium]|nr:chromosomal replication initiator protein DnaA [bacterium]HPD73925.1 chromosomal replication initiator protein DnaA [bacterium]HRY56842.1 chromosomal replication initiator protein DnaA [Patescibacteria group bacterium]